MRQDGENEVANLAESIHQLAELMGIEPGYTDIWGQRHATPLETKVLILRAMGVDTDSPAAVKRCLVHRRHEEWTRPGPQVWVTHVDEFRPLPVQIAAGPAQGSNHSRQALREAVLTMEDEQGQRRREHLPASRLQPHQWQVVEGRLYQRYLLDIPPDLEPGYYRMRLDLETGEGQKSHSLLLVICPDKAYLPPALAGEGKAAGPAVALYGLTSGRNWGVGDFTDLSALGQWTAKELKGSIIGLNPLLAIHNHPPYNHSPYLPITCFFKNFLYLDVEKTPGFSDSLALRREFESPQVQQTIRALRESPQVSYREVARIKRKFLWQAYLCFLERPGQDPLRREFERFVARQGELLEFYAVFMALYEHFARHDPPLLGWRNWPAPYQNPHSPAVRGFRDDHSREVGFHKFLQWELERQLSQAERSVRKAGVRLGLYHDLPLAVDDCGFDVWMNRHLFATDMSTGAPPDPFSPDGQDWGFPPPLPRADMNQGYRFFIAQLRRNMRPHSALRIDHAMRFFRLFWIPRGKSPSQGAYVRYPAQDLVGILALESVRNRTLIVGEDLGTVPPYVRQLLGQKGVFSYRLLYFEKDGAGNFKPPEAYPSQALVSITTHDLPTLEGFWKGLDLETRYKLGKFKSQDMYLQEKRARQEDKAKLLALLKERGLLPPEHPGEVGQVPAVTPQLHNAVVGFLASTPCKLLVINQEDIFRDQRQQNMPGTTWQVHNWVTKMRYNIEELGTHQVARGCTLMVRNWIEATGRG